MSDFEESMSFLNILMATSKNLPLFLVDLAPVLYVVLTHYVKV